MSGNEDKCILHSNVLENRHHVLTVNMSIYVDAITRSTPPPEAAEPCQTSPAPPPPGEPPSPNTPSRPFPAASVGPPIRQYREEAGLTQEQLADMAGLNRS